MVVPVLIVHLLVCIWGWYRLGVMAVAVAYLSVSQTRLPSHYTVPYDQVRIIGSPLESPLANEQNYTYPLEHRSLDENWNLPISASFSLGMMEYSSQQILSLYQID